ncbi:MAG: class I SAM-dependent methyltransferase [Bacillota bacterium]|nr:MAG: hypothetical protein DIU70_13695 [Bacillota bacterium]
MERKTLLASGYSESAPVYDATAGAQYLAGLRRLLPLLRPLPPWPAILDVGCGTGINLLEAARVFGPCRLLVGIDLSPGMVAVAQEKAAQAGVPATILLGDAEALPLPDATFDLVICNSAYHWFENRQQAVAEMARVLRPGGQLILICAADPGFREWAGLLEGTLRQRLGPLAPPAFPRLPEPEELYSHLLQAGLEPVYFNRVITPVRVQDPAGFVRLMATVAPSWQAALPPGLRAQVEQEVAGAMARVAPGGFLCTWAALEAVARRPAPPGPDLGPPYL